MVLIDMQQRGFTSVNPDNAMGGYLATRHLLRSGRRRIAMLSGSLAHFSIEQRNRGFRRALFESRTLADPDLEVIVPQLGDGDSGVVEAMQRLLSLPKPPDAVLCYIDSTALVAMAHCRGQGIKVPQDIAIVGFDDISGAATSVPPLSTLRVDKEALGAAGVDLLLRLKPEDPIEELVLPVDLVVRESSCDD